MIIIDDIIITGVTKLEDYPFCKYKMYCKSIIDTFEINIVDINCSILSLESLSVIAKVSSFKAIKTILGYKILIGIKKIYKLMYTLDDGNNTVRSLRVEDDIFEYILLEQTSYNGQQPYIPYIFVGIEDIMIQSISNNNIKVNLSMIMYPLIEEGSTISHNTFKNF